ncbi:MAG: hypothetical protein JXQ65_14490 [Candidatus Marinimicrobia bacterium]|nr:hypothetical protein [Candidatus Neomarinimicrobiota bacterium]
MVKHKLLTLSFSLVFMTTLYGEWRKLDFPTIESLWHVRFVNADTGWVLGEEYLYKTIDGGLTWKVQLSSLGKGILYVKGEDTIFLTNFNYHKEKKSDGILRSTDSGKTWSVVCCSPDYITKFDFVDENIGFAGGSNGDFHPLVKKTVDGGRTWRTICSDFPESEYEIEGISFINPDIGWAVTYAGQVYKTLDGGTNWALLTNFSSNVREAVRDIEFVNENRGMVIGGIAGQGKVWTTEDGGETWQSHNSLAKGSSMNELQFVDKNTCWSVGYGMFSDHSITHSQDFGSRWIGEAASIDGLVPALQDGFTSLSMISYDLGYFLTNVRPNYAGAIYKYI